MEPIVSPLFIYMLSVANSINGIMIGLLVLCTVFIVVACGMWVDAHNEWSSENDKKRAENFLKGMHVGLICMIWPIIFMAVILLPSRKTLIGMYVASHITVDNLSAAKHELSGIRETIKCDIIDIIQTLVDGKSEEKK